MQYVIYTIIAITLFAPAIVAQTSQNPCEADEVRQFDFWLGEWDLEWKGPKGEVQRGTNTITRILDGCVVRESFDGGKDLPLIGQSYSMFDGNSGMWKQTWVDNQGSYLDFTGEMKDAKMTLSREFTNRQGIQMRQRMVFFNIKQDSLDWNWENSTDGGKTWNLVWHISYTRKK